MISTLYSTAENPAGLLAQRIHFQQLEGARGPISDGRNCDRHSALNRSRQRTRRTDLEHRQRRAGRRLSCRRARDWPWRTGCGMPADPDRPGRSRARLSAPPARAPATRSQWARSWAPLPATSSRSNRDGLRLTTCGSSAALSQRMTALAVGLRVLRGAATESEPAKCGCSASTIVGAGTRATSVRFRWRTYAEKSDRS
jgi:hypothetical protein